MQFHKSILLLVLAVSALGLAQPSSPQALLKEIESLWHKSEKAGKTGDHQKAVEILREALALKPYPKKLSDLEGEFLVEIARHEILNGQPNRALESLDKALTAQYADTSRLKSEPAFSSLRANPRFQLLLERCDQNARQQRIFDVQAWTNPDLDFPGLHPFKESSKLEQLNKHYQLKKVIAGAETEWEGQLLLLDWVHEQWAHSGLQEPSQRDAWTILKEVEQGKRFRCVEYSVVLSEVLQSVGYPARVMWLRGENASFGLGKGHVVTEVWNNDFQKWIVLDGQNNAYWEVGGVPMSAQDMRRRWKQATFVSGESDWLNPPASTSDWNYYFVHLNAAVEREDMQTALVDTDERYEPLFQGTPARNLQTSDESKFYPRMNNVHFDLHPNEAKTELILKLSNSAPWFSHYQVRTEKGYLNLEGSEFGWKLKPGRNALQVRAVDKHGVFGPPSGLEVEYFER